MPNSDHSRLLDVVVYKRWRFGYVVAYRARGAGGGGLLPSNRLMRMCCWMGSYFHDWIDYYGVVFLEE